MQCGDAGPWLCLEPGCPAPVVGCDILRSACSARFSDVWASLPDPSLATQRVADACRSSCGRCAHLCELRSRHVLTAAHPAANTLEVQQLHFALPEGSRAQGPTAHVKVRAPDAPGQQGRVRAYSMLLDAGRRTFNLTVKVYPGGPPHTRGTSAFLGAAPVGTFVEVPETRAMLWSSSLSPSPRRVGMVAFGVGMAECLEPLELLLTAGAEVRLLTAYRREPEILYRERLRELLDAHGARLTVRHCLSQGWRTELRLAEGGSASCPTGERITNGRIDAAVVRQAFGDWSHRPGSASVSPLHFLVVGTGQMERSCWAWLQEELGVTHRQHALLAGSTGWRPLVPSAVAVAGGVCPARHGQDD
jgi:ferredoxin-NADP reductase